MISEIFGYMIGATIGIWIACLFASLINKELRIKLKTYRLICNWLTIVLLMFSLGSVFFELMTIGMPADSMLIAGVNIVMLAVCIFAFIYFALPSHYKK